MPQYFQSIPKDIQEWMLIQPVFWIASAPLTGKHINVSPKGHPSRTLHILNANKVAYLDHTGSGCETVSHLYENGRATVLFNSFGNSPRILRLFCTGTVHEKGSPQYSDLVKLFKDEDEDWQKEAIDFAARSVIVLDVFKVQTSCGYGVPILKDSVTEERKKVLTECVDSQWLDRDTLPGWARKLDKQKLDVYQGKNNARSLDGLPGLRVARRFNGEWMAGDGIRGLVSVVGRQLLVVTFTILALFALGLIDERRVNELYGEVGNFVKSSIATLS